MPINETINTEDSSKSNYEDVDEFISDKGITYNKADFRSNNQLSTGHFPKSKEKIKANLFIQF